MPSGKVILIVLDGVGVGAQPDAAAYGDEGAHTLLHTAEAVGGLALPNLARLGLGRIASVPGVPAVSPADGCFGIMAEQSSGKDSTTGHWELAGIVTPRPFPLYPHGFPGEVLSRFMEVTGARGVLGNKPASGTEIIAELGDEHLRTGYPIVYTSGDSVFQIAAHEEVLPLEQLYEMCRRTREKVMVGQHRVGRVIARPFRGTSGAFVRTSGRKDFGVEPDRPTLLDLLLERGIETVSVGKVDDLFSGRGLRRKLHTATNAEGIETIIAAGKEMQNGLLFANLVDFDMLYGHRQDPHGMARELAAFDASLPRIIGCLRNGDLLIVTADHGNDPADRSTDHTREYVPLLCLSTNGASDVDLGLRSSFADAAKTVAEYFGVTAGSLSGSSFLHLLF